MLLNIKLLLALNYLHVSQDSTGWIDRGKLLDINQNVLEKGQAYAALKQATTEIGHRLTGSQNGKKAEEFAYNFFKKSGIKKVKYAPFEVESWSRDTVSMAVAPANSDDFKDIKVVALAHSPVSASVMQEIIDCGDGLDDDFEALGTQIKGKVVLMNLGLMAENHKGKKNLHRSEKTALAIKYGAAGVIMVNQVDGGVLLTGTASVTGGLIEIPAVCISKEDGAFIRGWMAEKPNPKITAEINMKNYSKMIKARNVVATIKGTSKKHKNEKIVVGGHLDSWDLATGAIDNGIGSFSVLDIARTFADLGIKPKRTIEFVMFMGEEQGLLGSRALVKAQKASGEIDKVKLMLNLDMANNPNGFNAYGRPELHQFFKSMGQKIATIDTTYKNVNFNQAGLHSDHQPFMLEGVPVCSPQGGLSIKVLNCYHASCDRFELVDPKHIQNTVRYSAMMLYALSQVDKIPAERFDSEQTKNWMETQKLKNELIIGKDWRWNN